jgi:hypothetical protein
MSSAVHNLQQEIVAGEKSATQLFRSARLIAANLGLSEVATWLDHELDGYSDTEPLPKYRFVRTESVRALNPHLGWQHVADFTSRLPTGHPISEIEEWSKQTSLALAPPRALPLLPLTDESTGARLDWPQRITISGMQFKSVVEGAKTALLQWTIDLERLGIQGEDMKFDERENQAASGHQTFNIQTLVGVAGNITGSQVTVNDYGAIHDLLKQRNVPQRERNELENIMDELKTASAMENPTLVGRAKEWVVNNKDFLGASADVVRRALGIP